MATGKALNGKPYAGNPHVRFDEGEVALAATPRRGSLLYIQLSAVLLSAAVCANPADPQISNVRLQQDAITRRVTVKYDLDETAVVTMDVLTNGVSIGGANIQAVTGDCFKRVAAGNDHVVMWNPYLSWPDQRFGAGVVSVRMTAWALDNTPDYMVVDITSTGGADTQTYYPSADFVPRGVTNGLYKTTSFLMRKIMAKDVKWTMGSTKDESLNRVAEREETHQVTLTNNYYIGVYEVTQSQWGLVATNSAATANFTTERGMRPMDNVSYNEIRNTHSTSASATGVSAGTLTLDPSPDSFLGLLRLKTGLNFDLPSESQWEFAARAGNVVGYWNDGSSILNTNLDENLNRLGRYLNNPSSNSTTSPVSAIVPADGGTAIVGFYVPNAWGLYDMHGNVWEWCLDWYTEDITGIDGKVNIDPADPANPLLGSPGSRVMRGGSWRDTAGICRPAFRNCYAPSTRNSYFGFRIVCSAGLQ